MEVYLPILDATLAPERAARLIADIDAAARAAGTADDFTPAI